MEEALLDLQIWMMYLMFWRQSMDHDIYVSHIQHTLFAANLSLYLFLVGSCIWPK